MSAQQNSGEDFTLDPNEPDIKTAKKTTRKTTQKQNAVQSLPAYFVKSDADSATAITVSAKISAAKKAEFDEAAALARAAGYDLNVSQIIRHAIDEAISLAKSL